MYTWLVFYENADTDDPACCIGTVNADSMSTALEKAALAFNAPSHDLIVRRENVTYKGGQLRHRGKDGWMGDEEERKGAATDTDTNKPLGEGKVASETKGKRANDTRATNQR